MATKQMQKTQKPVDHFKAQDLDALNPLSAAEQKMVDDFAAAGAELAPHKELIKRYESLKKKVGAIAGDENRYPDADAPVLLRGKSGIVEYSARDEAREISDKQGVVGALKAKLGYDGLLEIVNVNLGDIDKYLSAAESSKYIDEVPGSRKLAAVNQKP